MREPSMKKAVEEAKAENEEDDHVKHYCLASKSVSKISSSYLPPFLTHKKS
jgi:hypothetical protein